MDMQHPLILIKINIRTCHNNLYNVKVDKQTSLTNLCSETKCSNKIADLTQFHQTSVTFRHICQSKISLVKLLTLASFLPLEFCKLSLKRYLNMMAD